MVSDQPARWEDLEAFLVMAEGVRNRGTVQEVGEQRALHGFGDARLLYLRLARLERAFGATLIRRRKWSRDTQLTPEGEWLYTQLFSLADVRRTLHQHFDQRRAAPVLRLSSARSLVTTVLPAFLEHWSAVQGRDALRVHMEAPTSAAAAEELVRAGRVHAAVNLPEADRPKPPGLREVVVRRDVRAVVLCPRAHPFAQRRRGDSVPPVSRAELAEETVIGPDPDVRMPWLPRPRLRGSRMSVASYEFARSYVRMGLGLAVGFDIVEALRPAEKSVVVLPLNPPVFRKAILLLPNISPVHPSPLAREFLDELASFLRELPAGTPLRSRTRVGAVG